MPTQRPIPVTVRHRRRFFRRNTSGSAAVEFALIAPIFFALLFAIIEYALMFFASQVLETATHDTARLIMTGQAQTAKLDKTKFKEELCKQIVALFDCKNGIYIDVMAYPSFAGIQPSDIGLPIDGDKKFVDGMRYVPGVADEVVIVRVFYQWQLFVTGWGFDLSNLADGKRLLVATAAFRNEPFGEAGS